jgi:hypothetical protein
MATDKTEGHKNKVCPVCHRPMYPTTSTGIGSVLWDLDDKLFQPEDTKRDGFWEGRALRVCNWASLIYICWSLLWLIVYSLACTRATDMVGLQRLLATFVGVIVAAGPPAFFWTEAKAFDRWVNKKYPSVDDQKSWRETYRLNEVNGKAFWAAMVAVYGAVLLIK